MEYALISEKGSRILNEDCCGVKEVGNSVCFTLCDGLGGHAKGEVASQAAVKSFENTFEKAGGNPDGFFKTAFSECTESFEKLAEETPVLSLMKTTVVSLVISEKECIWAHIGDSRLYGFKNSKAILCTEDHSVPEMLVKSGKIKKSEIRNHPDRNKLLKAFGADDEQPEYEISNAHTATEFDAFLLCSDGFWELINERKMARFLKHSSDADEWLVNMTKSVRRKGRRRVMDNYSAIAIILKKEGKSE